MLISTPKKKIFKQQKKASSSKRNSNKTNNGFTPEYNGKVLGEKWPPPRNLKSYTEAEPNISIHIFL